MRGLILVNINWRRVPINKKVIEIRMNIKFWSLIKIKIGIIFCQVIKVIFIYHEAVLESLSIHIWKGGKDIFIKSPTNKINLISIIMISWDDLWFIII